VPKLPWESKEKYYEIILEVLKDIKRYEKELSIKEKIISDYSSYNENEFKNFLGILRDYRRQLQEKKNHIISQDIVAIVKYIYSLENIYKEEDRSIALEKYIALALYALNDILRIQPNYPVGDDNEPTFTAPAGKPDIECYYEYFNAICEVTMLTGRDQWYYEGQPIMRHLREFEIKNKDKVAFCIFIAPVLHRDTLNTFWFSIKYEYEGSPQKIIPLTIKNFIDILKTLVDLKQKGVFLSHVELFNLYSDILSYAEKVNNAINWVENIPKIIFNWQNKLTS
ncbi:MAG: AlwI family type II restriction endonuclease, partial [Actinobacteria bacterium]|nr:AlwI family type II restriction endonuclease [Actinomycetota bacterium]